MDLILVAQDSLDSFHDATEDMSCMQFMPGTQRTMYFDRKQGDAL